VSREYGDHVCDDVILVPVKSQQRVRYFTVSAEKGVILCEVQIFAGKSLYYCYYCYYIIYINYMCARFRRLIVFLSASRAQWVSIEFKIVIRFYLNNCYTLSIRVCYCLILKRFKSSRCYFISLKLRL